MTTREATDLPIYAARGAAERASPTGSPRSWVREGGLREGPHLAMNAPRDVTFQQCGALAGCSGWSVAGTAE